MSSSEAVPGQPAPELVLLDPEGRPHSLRAWRGQPLVLVFLRWLG